MAKQILSGDEARHALLKGVNILSNVVKATLGPRGKNIVLDKKFGSPTSTKDGVTVAKEVELKDPWENMGAQLVKEVASKTSDVAGDGTTTATVLAQAIYGEGLRYVTAGANPTLIKKGIDKAVETVVDELKKMSREVSGEMIAQVGAISANNDPSIGKIIAEAMDKVGKDGVITVEEAKGLETTMEIVEGMQFDRGYLSPYFVTDPERMECVLEKPLILLHEKKISNLKDFLPLLENVARMGRPLRRRGRGSRGRSPGHPGRQQAQGHLPVLRRQGPRLRRPPQGHARGHRHPDRRPGHHRGDRRQAREGRRRLARRGQEGRHRQGQHDHRRGHGQGRPTSRPGSSRSAPRSKIRPPTTTARSSRSGWPRWSAAWP